ncbi:MAG: D-alanine-D-alanine ligase [Parcubacteria bacterium C7867-001]|nr:MAG: D-alanine-D-alanine ligase [Parcubacteria bacterium C7867-001]
MRGTVVGVLRGGPSREHEVSLKTGHAILSNLDMDRFTPRDIYIDKAGLWHERGVPTTPDRVLRNVDVVVLGLHGEYGEDGEVQKLLERYGIPYTGSDSFSSYLAMHKFLAKERVTERGILSARSQLIEPSADIAAIVAEINRTFPQPVVVKPVKWGSSVGVSFTHGYQPLLEAVQKLLDEGAGGVLVEERIKGTEATVGVIENFRDEVLYALPPVEIIPPDADFFSYDAKYSGATREICPARFPKKVTDELIRLAREAHESLGLRHYSRSDFIVSPRGIYYLETNTLPGLTTESLMPKSLAAVGVSYPDFLSHLVDLAMKK